MANSYLDKDGLAHVWDKAKGTFALKSEIPEGSGIATPERPGIVKPGGEFDVAEDGTLSMYKKMEVTSFTVSPSSVERGSTVATVTAKWALNKVPKTLDLNGQQLGVSETSKELAENLKADKTYTVKATDARGAAASRNATVYFRDKRHWFTGAYDAEGVTDSVINAAAGELATARQKSFTLDAEAGQHIYYAYPHAWGAPRFFVGGFEGGFALLKTFDHVNASGAKVSYDVYKSANAGLGNTTVEVK